MSVLGRVASILGGLLLIVALIIGVLNWVVIRDYLVALSSDRSRQFYDVRGREWITYLMMLASGFLLGIGFMGRFGGRRNPPNSPQ